MKKFLCKEFHVKFNIKFATRISGVLIDLSFRNTQNYLYSHSSLPENTKLFNKNFWLWYKKKKP